jgi:hypothetical protein
MAASKNSDELYRRMGLSFGCAEDEIKKAYRKLALKYHPDRTRGDEAKTRRFIAIKEAYAVLADPKARADHDKNISAEMAKRKRDAERTGAMDATRRKMKDELFAREAAADARRAGQQYGGAAGGAGGGGAAAERAAKRQRTAAVNNLRAQNARMAERFSDAAASSAAAAATSAAAAAAQAAAPAHAAHATAEDYERTADLLAARALDERLRLRKRQVKLRWRRSASEQSHSEDSVARAVRRFGTVEAVKMGEKGKSATVTFEDEAAAAAIAAADDDAELHGAFKEVERLGADRWARPAAAGGSVGGGGGAAADGGAAGAASGLAFGAAQDRAVERFLDFPAHPVFAAVGGGAKAFEEVEAGTLQRMRSFVAMG